MTSPVVLVLGLVASIAIAVIAKRFTLPYPIIYVLAGTVLAFVPGLPRVQIAPDWIFLAVLPPLLFAAGWNTDWIIFRSNLRPILQLAIGLVIVTTIAVAFVAGHIIPGLGIASAFVLGAIVSPPDAVAAEATFERFSVPRRIVAVVKSEGMLNDATALVIYGFAVSAAASSAFSLKAAAVSFAVVAAGGVLLGIVVAWLTEAVSRTLARYDLSDTLIENLLLIATPYVAYLAGEVLHVSGVLAVVIAGIALSRRSSVIYGPQTRLTAWNVWTLWIYVLNAFMFLAIGLQLRAFVSQGARFFDLLPAALAVSALVILVRMAWVYAESGVSRAIPALARSEPIPPTWLAVIGWSGMRGIISLAAALALPSAFPRRADIVFITFVVIFVTLVGQGLTLNSVLRLLHVCEEEDEEEREIDLRLRALEAGLRRIGEIEREADDEHEREDLERLRHEYESRIAHLRAGIGGDQPTVYQGMAHDYLEREALAAERRAIMQLRNSGEIPDETFRRIEYDLDLAESRLV